MDVPYLVNQLLSRLEKPKQAKLADALQVSQASISRWKNGKQEPTLSEGLRLIEFARKEGVFGPRRDGMQPYNVPIVGVVGLGEGVDWIEDTSAMPLGEVEVPFALPDECFALEARGDSMAPRIKNGELVVVRRNGKTASEMIGEEAVVKTAKGEYLYKTIRRGYEPNSFNLESFNAPLRENVMVEWVAEVWVIVPRSAWRKLP